ncbi:dihydropteroate synthase, partial [Pseudomonas sp. FW305-3-2-15-E-TSA4]
MTHSSEERMSEMRTDRSSPGDSNGNALDGSSPRADGPVRRPLVMAVVN